MSRKDNLSELLNCLLRATPEQFLGIARMLNVAWITADGKVMNAEDLVVKICENFEGRNRVQQRNLLKLVKKATAGQKVGQVWTQDAAEGKCEGYAEVNDGTPTENS